MRQSKEITIDNKKVTIYELSVRKIKQLWKDATDTSPETGNILIFSNEQILRDHWDECVHGLKLEETEDMAPSELKLIYDGFKEVNAIFLDLVQKLEGVNPFLKGLSEAIMNDLTLRFAVLSPTDTPESGTTDTPSL